MKIYLAGGGSPKAYPHLDFNILATYYSIKYPMHRWGAVSDFKWFINKIKLCKSTDNN
jgi:hypothetical protein